jgi:hypothetical protein
MRTCNIDIVTLKPKQRTTRINMTSTPHTIATGDATPSEPTTMETSVGDTVPTPPPAILAEYNQLTRQVRMLNQRINALKPALKSFVASMPSQSIDAGDGKIRIATLTRSTPITRRFVTTALVDMLKEQDQGGPPLSDADRDALVAATVAFIWQRRTVRTTQRLMRTWTSTPKRHADDMRD